MGKFNDNPWLGLESYQENQIIYGRNKEIEELSQCVLNNNETVLYGKSGIGKSSIINAGIIPVLRTHGYTPVVVRLDHSNKHSYIKQLSDLIEKATSISECTISKNAEEQLLWEYFHTHYFNKTTDEKSKLVVIFDQFEEIFTLQNNAAIKGRFFKELGDVLNNVMPKELVKEQTTVTKEGQTSVPKQESVSGFADMADLFSSLAANVNNSASKYIEDNDIHFVFSLREDFLSELEYYTSKIPSLKQHRYALRPLNEEQSAEVILKPRPELVDEGVARLIIETVTNRTDFAIGDEPEIDVDAAVLSLFLSQIYDKREAEDAPISIDLVKTFGKDIIKDFYEESIEGLSSAQIDFLEEELLTGESRRDNLSKADFKAGGFSDSELKHLIDDKKLLRQFHYEGDLRVEFIHDILCPVVKERKEQREMLRQQEEERIRQEEEKRKLQEEAELKQREIEEKAAREKIEMEEEARKTRKRNQRIYISVASVFLAILMGGIYFYFANFYTYKTYYKEFTRINGWPVGIGNQLSEKDRLYTPLYYCLSHKGSKFPVKKLFGSGSDNDVNTDVEVLSSNLRLPHKPRIASFEIADASSGDGKARAYNEILSNVCKIHFVEGENNTIEKEVAFNDNDSILFVVNYFHINNSDMWGSFVSPSGQAMQIRDNGIDRTKISLDSLGRIRSMMYYDQNGVIQPISDVICGYAWEFGKNKGEKKRYTLNQFSLPIDKGCNMVETRLSGDTVITRYRHVMSLDDKIGVESSGPEGFCLTKQIGDETLLYISESSKKYSAKHITRDSRGNILIEQITDNPLMTVPSIINYTYDEDGNLIKLEKLTSDKAPFAVDEKDDYLFEWEYRDGKTVREVRKNKTQVTYRHTIETNNDITRELFEDVYAGKYLVRVDSTFKDGYSTSYFGRNNQPVNYKVCVEEDSLTFHRKRCVLNNNEEYRYFYVFDGTEKKAPLEMDEYGKAISYYCKIIKKDNEGRIIAYKELDENNRIVKSMMFFTLNGQIIGRAVEGVDGTPVRCGKWEEEGFMYYKIYYVKDFEDNFVGVRGMNEWGQSSAFYDSYDSKYQSVSYRDFKGAPILYGSHDIQYEYLKNRYRLTSDNFTEIKKSYKQYVFSTADMSAYSYPYLHILDKASSLYQAGFKDGDRIVKFGNWSIGQKLSVLENEWNSYFSNGKNIKLEVLRPLPDGSVTRISKVVGCSPSSENLQEYHVLALTQEEYAYLFQKSILK